MHGLASDSTMWENKLKKLFSVKGRPEENSIKVFCPKSPEMPITRFDGKIMNSWFNVYDMYTSDNQGIRNAATVSSSILFSNIKGFYIGNTQLEKYFDILHFIDYFSSSTTS